MVFRNVDLNWLFRLLLLSFGTRLHVDHRLYFLGIVINQLEELGLGAIILCVVVQAEVKRLHLVLGVLFEILVSVLFITFSCFLRFKKFGYVHCVEFIFALIDY